MTSFRIINSKLENRIGIRSFYRLHSISILAHFNSRMKFYGLKLRLRKYDSYHRKIKWLYNSIIACLYRKDSRQLTRNWRLSDKKSDKIDRKSDNYVIEPSFLYRILSELHFEWFGQNRNSSKCPWNSGSVWYSFNRVAIRSWSIEMWINKIPECGPRILEIPKNNNLTILAMYRGLMYMIYS